jgi:hypothetical protein
LERASPGWDALTSWPKEATASTFLRPEIGSVATPLPMTCRWAPVALPIDTGFIVYNDRNYPNLIQALFKELGVASKETSMGFSVCDEATGLEYAGNNLNTLFAQRGNLLSPSFLGMIREILRFNKLAIAISTVGGYRQTRRWVTICPSWFQCAFQSQLFACHDLGHLVGRLSRMHKISPWSFLFVSSAIMACSR